MKTCEKFEKRRFVVDAIQLTSDNGEAVKAFIDQTAPLAGALVQSLGNQTVVSWVAFGAHQTASVGNWVILDLKGEHYQIPAAEFPVLYAPVDYSERSMADVNEQARHAVEMAGREFFGREFDATLHAEKIDAALTAAYAAAMASFTGEA